MGFPADSVAEKPPASAVDSGSIPGWDHDSAREQQQQMENETRKVQSGEEQGGDEEKKPKQETMLIVKLVTCKHLLKRNNEP